MAKRQVDQGNSPRPAKVRYFELEGNDETVQRALETFERMRRPVEVLPPLRKQIATASTSPSEPSLYDEVESGDSAEGTTAVEHADNGQPEGQRRKRGEGAGVDRNSAIVAAEVDLYPKGKTSLRDFFAQKSPKSDMDRSLVICFYLQEILQLPNFGAGHVLSGFNQVGSIPVDLPATLRNMRKNKKVWLAFTDLESLRVATNGLNRVRHEMGNGKDEDNGAK